MKIKFQVDESGQGYVAALDPDTGEHRKAATLKPGQEIELDVAPEAALTVAQVGFGDVVDSSSGETAAETPGPEAGQEPADKPGAGNEGSPAQPPAPEAGEATAPSTGEGAPAPEGTDQQAGDQGTETAEPPSTSAASEKPLYLVDGRGLRAVRARDAGRQDALPLRQRHRRSERDRQR